MKIPYREYLRRLPGSEDFQLILRPIVSIRIFGATMNARWDALVDTGADETLLPMSLAEVLGIPLDHEHTSRAAGISGDELTIYYGDVEFRIEVESEVVAWKTTVGFVEFGSSADEVIVLGHGGCLDYFTAVFDGERAELELVPNSYLPASTVTPEK